MTGAAGQACHAGGRLHVPALTLSLTWCILALAVPTLPEIDSGSRLVLVPAAVAEGGDAQAMRLTLWPLRDPSTGDRNLDLLQDLPSLRADATRPLDGLGWLAGSDDDPALALPRSWANPVAQGESRSERMGQPVMEAAAAMLPALSQRQLFGGAEVVLAQTREDLPDEARMRSGWRAIAAYQATGKGAQGGGPAGHDAAQDRQSQRPMDGAAWLEWPVGPLQLLREYSLWLLLGLGALVGLGYAAKAYSRRI